ncbi:MAG: hypothetical protein HKP58_15275, partial [Desulfatitalea sp.]|nr:hypothetical protein [Desulfatitalea sp.]NNK01771.1 hypothetical protein [Desulfatitalea sp.]
MTTTAQHTIDVDPFSRRGRRTWMWSGVTAVTAVGMNLFFFLLIPHSLDPAPRQFSLGTLVPRVKVIRMARPERPVECKPVKPAPEPKSMQKPRTVPGPSVRAKLTLPFEVNPTLASAPVGFTSKG